MILFKFLFSNTETIYCALLYINEQESNHIIRSNAPNEMCNFATNCSTNRKQKTSQIQKKKENPSRVSIELIQMKSVMRLNCTLL